MLDIHLINVNFYSEQEKCIPLTYFDDDDESQCDITYLVLQLFACYIMVIIYIDYIG